MIKSRKTLLPSSSPSEMSAYLITDNPPASSQISSSSNNNNNAPGINLQSLIANNLRSTVSTASASATSDVRASSTSTTTMTMTMARKSVTDNLVPQSNVSAANATGNENNYTVWQTEMEKGYEALINSILPFISDLKESETLTPRK
jgi:hypothetical protein